MKPSEYLFNEDFMILNDDYKLKVINKLDKRFIDREELKKQIKKLYKQKQIEEDSEYIEFTEDEILELLK